MVRNVSLNGARAKEADQLSELLGLGWSELVSTLIREEFERRNGVAMFPKKQPAADPPTEKESSTAGQHAPHGLEKQASAEAANSLKEEIAKDVDAAAKPKRPK